MDDCPAHRMPGGITDYHRQRAAKGNAGLYCLMYDRIHEQLLLSVGPKLWPKLRSRQSPALGVQVEQGW